MPVMIQLYHFGSRLLVLAVAAGLLAACGSAPVAAPVDLPPSSRVASAAGADTGASPVVLATGEPETRDVDSSATPAFTPSALPTKPAKGGLEVKR